MLQSLTALLARVSRRARRRFQSRCLLIGGAGLVLVVLLGGLLLYLLPRASLSHQGKPAASLRPLPTSSNSIHLIQMFDYDISPDQITSQRAQPIDLVWGADANPAKLQAWRRANPGIVLSFYLSFERDSQQHALSYWQQSHPDWILYQCDRKTPAYLNQQAAVPLDFSNPAVRQWQLETFGGQAQRLGYDALAVDDVSVRNVGGACGHYEGRRWVPLYSGAASDRRWSQQVVVWLRTMQQRLHHLSHPLDLIVALAVGGAPSEDASVQALLNSIDVVVLADGFSARTRAADWLSVIRLMEQVQQQHKAIYIVNQFTPPPHQFSLDSQQVQWALASYLMGQEAHAGLYIGKEQQFGQYLYYPSYAAQVGAPLGQMYSVAVGRGGAVYLRDFSQGESLVNPDGQHSYQVRLPAGRLYHTLQGQAVGSTVTLAPHSGLVLLARTLPTAPTATFTPTPVVLPPTPTPDPELTPAPVQTPPTPVPTPALTPTSMPTVALPTPTPTPLLTPTPTLVSPTPTPALTPTLTPTPTPTAAPSPTPTMLPTPTPTPIPVTYVAQDNFQRTNQSTWGIASNGNTWQVDNSADFPIFNDTGRIIGTQSGIYNAILGPTSSNVEILATFTFVQLQGSDVGVVARWNDTNDWYKLGVNNGQFFIVKDVAGTKTTLSSMAFTPQSGSTYTMRFAADGTTLAGKIWLAGTAEPDWQLVVTDSSFNNGHVGIRPAVASGMDVRVSWFGAVAL